jgi:hypothetical protein
VHACGDPTHSVFIAGRGLEKSRSIILHCVVYRFTSLLSYRAVCGAGDARRAARPITPLACVSLCALISEQISPRGLDVILQLSAVLDFLVCSTTKAN